ncbi:hypothetical protein EDB19DRAFT_1908769 [Suillus lakei]|nr:hypothetical protein EDB19DRAFT_1908769 [Suillus lakei]
MDYRNMYHGGLPHQGPATILDTWPSQPVTQDTDGSDQPRRLWDNLYNLEPQTLHTVTPSKDMVIVDERPDQPFDWVQHNTFDFDNPVIEGGLPLGSQSMIDEAYYSCLFSPQVHHAPYTISQRHHHGDLFSHTVEQGSFVDVVPPALGVPPPAPVTPPTTPSPVPSPVPSPMAAAQTAPLIIFGLANLSNVKAEALLQMKCSIFDSSFLPSDNSDVERMAKACITAQVSHSTELTAWANTKAGEQEVAKLCTALTTLQKNVKFLTCSVMLWGYDLHQLMHTESKHAMKKFVESLVTNNSFLRGVITACHFFLFLINDCSCYFLQVSRENVDIPFGNVAVLYYIRQLLFHNRQYKQFIDMKQNLQPLFTYTSVLFKWALTEMSSGVFKDLDVKLTEATMEHTVMETLLEEQHCALTASVYNYGE